jgi:hypothetical protein
LKIQTLFIDVLFFCVLLAIHLKENSLFIMTYHLPFYLLSKAGNGRFGNIAIDDIQFTSDVEKCPVSTSPSTPSSVIDCDFERSNICGYTADDTFDSFKWERVQVNIYGFNDHTYNVLYDGHAMHAKALTQRDATRIARLFSPQLLLSKNTNDETHFITFWFRSSGQLSLRVRKFASDIFSDDLWHVEGGGVATEWSLARVALAPSNGSYQLVFEAYDIGQTVRDGEAWLDDVSLLTGQIGQLASCFFNEPINPTCGYTYDSSGSTTFSWMLLTGDMDLGGYWTKPVIDGTSGLASGGYMYLATRDRTENDRAVFESDVVPNNAGGKCLRFYLKADKVAKRTLSVGIKDKSTGEVRSIYALMSSTTGGNDSNWRIVEAGVGDSVNPFSIVFEGVIGVDQFKVSGVGGGELAVDDVLLYDGNCSSVCPGGYCKNDGFCFADNKNEKNGFKCVCDDSLFDGDYCENLKEKSPAKDDSNGLIL